MLHLESSYAPNMMTLASQASVLARTVSSPTGLPLKPSPAIASSGPPSGVTALHVAPSAPATNAGPGLPLVPVSVSTSTAASVATSGASNASLLSPDCETAEDVKCELGKELLFQAASLPSPDLEEKAMSSSGSIPADSEVLPSRDELSLSPGSSKGKSSSQPSSQQLPVLPRYKTSTPEAIHLARASVRRSNSDYWAAERKVSDHSVMKLLERYADDAAAAAGRERRDLDDVDMDDLRYAEMEEMMMDDKGSFDDSDQLSDVDRRSHNSYPGDLGSSGPGDNAAAAVDLKIPEAPPRTLVERKQKRKQTLPQQVLDQDDSGVAPAKRSLLQTQVVVSSTLHDMQQRLETMEHQLRSIDKRSPEAELRLMRANLAAVAGRHRNRSEGHGLLNNNNNNINNNNNTSSSTNHKDRSGKTTDSDSDGSSDDMMSEEMQELKNKLKEEISGYLDSFYGNICDLVVKMKKEWEAKAAPPPPPPPPPPATSSSSSSALPSLPLTSTAPVHPGLPPPHPPLPCSELPGPLGAAAAAAAAVAAANASSDSEKLCPPEPLLAVTSSGPRHLPPGPLRASVSSSGDSPIVSGPAPNGPPPQMPLCSLPSDMDRLKMAQLPGLGMGPAPGAMFHPHFNHELSRRMLEDFRPLGPHFPCPPMPSLPFYGPPGGQHPHPFLKRDQEQTEALPLVVNAPKKKRTKVTDTRLSPRAARSILMAENGGRDIHDPSCYPMVYPPFSSATAAAAAAAAAASAAGVPGPFHPDMMPIYRTGVGLSCMSLPNDNLMDRISPGCRDSLSPSSIYPDQMDNFDGYDNIQQTSTLTPIHLRKAKLMFFYTRYPSSAVLKVYFPDVKFNKNNTAQLVKWFSNFREFYYIQMEKYARQAIAEGVKASEEIKVSTESELYRVLNLHYNRNNQIEVPEHFRVVIESTLREFYKSLVAGKDQEQSWKKPIYKIIARMDQSVPDFFKSTNWMEQLADN